MIHESRHEIQLINEPSNVRKYYLVMKSSNMMAENITWDLQIIT